jgi:Transglycosylase-like domain
LPHRSNRRVAAIAGLVGIVTLVSIQTPVDTQAHARGIDRFLYALAQVESGGNYRARNPVSGAYGKYQIMPFNWGPWARRYVGYARALPTPRNQETVARRKVHALHHWLGSWRRVAYWWLTGKSNTSGWSAYATRYVRNVMAIYRGTRIVESKGDIRRYSEKSRAIDYKGTWERAKHAYYRGDRVRQAKRAGQTATFRFTGSQVAWNGPKGPTRGKAKVYLDGMYLKTVDLYAPRFDARNRIFTRSFADSGAHTLTIKVLGTRGRPVVSIDEFVVWE